jgi:5'-nucleotidase (lipoprotein e(P4) family)
MVRFFSARLALVGAAALLATCTGQTPTTAPPQHRDVRRSHENLNAVLWMQTAVEYRASALQAYHAARLALDASLHDPHETAAVEQTGDYASLPPAVILDLDETVFDNSPFEARLIADARPYSDAAWRGWIDEGKQSAIPGAVEFLEYARSRGVTPIYVTNSSAADGGDELTRRALERLHAPVANGALLMRDENGWNSTDKGSRRAYVSQRYRILLLVGDNFEDFMSVPQDARTVQSRDTLAAKYSDRWGSRWIVLPNPTYGSWEQAVTAGASPGDALARKYAALRLDR